jgi:hypothetical protein
MNETSFSPFLKFVHILWTTRIAWKLINLKKQNKGLFVFDTVFIRAIIWLTLSGSPDNGPDKNSIGNKMPLNLKTSKKLGQNLHKISKLS